MKSKYEDCPDCDGTGKVLDAIGFFRNQESRCEYCRGTGVVEVDRDEEESAVKQTTQKEEV